MLIVFEGPDEVGKTTLSLHVTEALREAGRDVEQLSFPGHEPGTPGDLVYKLHHDASRLNVEPPTPASLQLFHCAAHADVIEKRIAPALAQGHTVVLDRGWWSLVVYAQVGGVDVELVGTLREVERALWRPMGTPVFFLIDAPAPRVEVPDAKAWQKLRAAYSDLADSELASGAIVHRIANDDDPRVVATHILNLLT